MTLLRSPEQEVAGKRKVDVVNISTQELLFEMLIVLKKIEYHLSVGSGDEFKDDDV